MGENPVTKESWQRADKIIELANGQLKDSTIGKPSSSLPYAAARLNAFNVATSATDAEDMKKDKEAAIEYFTEQYKKMLIENLDDYIENYASDAPGG